LLRIVSPCWSSFQSPCFKAYATTGVYRSQPAMLAARRA
jgi:hypothetical protein